MLAPLTALVGLLVVALIGAGLAVPAPLTTAAQLDCQGPPTGTAAPIQAQVGQAFTLVLEANHTTGYQWQLSQSPDSAVANAAGNQYAEPGTLPGAPGLECWTFDAVGAGSTTVGFNYVRPFEPDAEPAQTASFTVDVAAGATESASGSAPQGAAWLDAPPSGWNTPGVTAPPQAPAPQNTDPRCQEQEAAPSNPQEDQVSGLGWKLQQYWPAVSGANVMLITALAAYDGMCRPNEFNVFVYADEQYVGTLSPVNMNSRTDGALAFHESGLAVAVAADGTIQADFTRYAPTDALCCPSRGETRVTYRVEQAAGGDVVTPVEIAAAPAVATPEIAPTATAEATRTEATPAAPTAAPQGAPSAAPPAVQAPAVQMPTGALGPAVD